MRIRVLDLDGSLLNQPLVVNRCRGDIVPLRDWSPSIRLACPMGRFRNFEQRLSRRLEGEHDREPWLSFYGSGDFHHVTLALLRRLDEPFNLLVLDNHPDWMRGIPFLHCGTWLNHAAQLPHVQRIFHVGGDVDFDNFFRPLAPWPLIELAKITVFPARRKFQGGRWGKIRHDCLREEADIQLTRDRMEALLEPFREDLARRPLYISFDKDVLRTEEAAVNWDSGHLTLKEVGIILDGFQETAKGRLAGVDTTGDHSPVHVQGFLRRLLHWTEHPPLLRVPFDAPWMNQSVNLALLERFQPRDEGAPTAERWVADAMINSSAA